jgi:hypothetical protein
MSNDTGISLNQQTVLLEAVKHYQVKKIHCCPLSKNKVPLLEKWNDKHFSLEDFEVEGLAGIGSCPGLWPKPLMVIDVDGQEGRKSLEQCLQKYGPLSGTYTVRSGREEGGEHLYYRVPEDLYVKSNASVLAKHIDLRGTRGQAVLPPTIHKSGNIYQWLFDAQPVDLTELDLSKIPMLPEPWVEGLIETNCAYWNSEQKQQEFSPGEFQGHSSAYALKALEEEAAQVRSAQKGSRNGTLNKACFSVGQLVGGGELSASIAENVLYDSALACGLDAREAQDTVQRSLEDGMKHPRRAPDAGSAGKSKKGALPEASSDGDDAGYAGNAGKFEELKTLSLPPAPLDVFHQRIADAISNISEAKKTPPEVVISLMLAMASALVCCARGITIKTGWSENANLFIALVGSSSCGKSPAANTIFRPIYQKEKEFHEEYQMKLEAYSMEHEAWQQDKERKKTEPKPTPPVRKDLILDDWTIEAAANALLNNPKGILLYRDELAGMFRDLDKYSGEKGSTKTRLMQAYDGKKPWKITRKSGGTTFIPRPGLSIYGTIQPGVVLNLFNREDLESGFLNRFIFIHAVQKEPSFFSENEETYQTVDTIKTLVDGLAALDYSEEGRFIGVTEEAKEEFIKWHDDLAMEAFYSTKGMGALLSKVRAQGLRITLIMHAMDSVLDGKDEMKPVSRDTMTRALKLMNWLRIHTEATWQMLKGQGQPPMGQDVIVARAVTSLVQPDNRDWLATQEITDKVNEGLDRKHHLQSSQVGRICTRLGLEPKRTSQAKGYNVTPEDAARLSELLPRILPAYPAQPALSFIDEGFGYDPNISLPAYPALEVEGVEI